ncbi:hypothetical protein ACVWW6_007809 [Bradyrhizobium sp. USDA 3311]
MVVAGQRQHAAIERGAGRIGVLERVNRAVDAGALAVPDAEHAIDLGAGKQPDLLAAPDRGRSQVLVQAGHEGDVVLLEERLRPPQRVVVHAERGTAVAGDEAAGVEALKPVAFALQHGQSNQGLRAGQEDPLRFEPVFVVQLDLHQRHFGSPCYPGRAGDFAPREACG